MELNTIFFIIFSAVAVISSLVMITRKHPLSSALSLVITFIALAGLYSLLAAKLVFVIQILVYAGAIMMLVIFSIMLLNVKDEDLPNEGNIYKRASLALILTVPILAIFIRAISKLPYGRFVPVGEEYGTVKSVGFFLFTEFAFPFEVISILLLVSLVGSIVLAKRRI